MNYTIICEQTVEGTVDGIWQTWTDMPAYPQWDPREEELRIDGPFQVGTTGFSKQVGKRPGSTFRLTRVDPKRRWTNECPLPGGRLELDHELEPAGPESVRLTKTYRVHGPLSLLFRVYYGREIRRQVPETLQALAGEAARRAGANHP